MAACIPAGLFRPPQAALMVYNVMYCTGTLVFTARASLAPHLAGTPDLGLDQQRALSTPLLTFSVAVYSSFKTAPQRLFFMSVCLSNELRSTASGRAALLVSL